MDIGKGLVYGFSSGGFHHFEGTVSKLGNARRTKVQYHYLWFGLNFGL